MVLAPLVGCKPGKTEKITEIYALKADPTEQNKAAIRTMLDDPDRNVRATALNALVTLRVDDSAELARASLGDPDGFVRATAAKLVGDLGSDVDVGELVRMLADDRDPIVRQRAAEALTEIGGGQAVEGLAAGLADPIENVRLAAVRGLRGLDPAHATAELIRLLVDDPSYEIRVQSARALGATGAPEVRPALERALEDPNEFVRAAAAHALEVHKAVLEGRAGRQRPGGTPAR